jgi:hypothetical protein
MVERGDWGRGDDKRMLAALRDGDYEREWEVSHTPATSDWKFLVPSKSHITDQ